MHRSLVLFLTAAGLLAMGAAVGRAEDSGKSAMLRRPVDLAVAGNRLYVANQRSGSLSVIDRSTRRVTTEIAVGKRLSNLAVANGGGWLLATDEGRHELVLLDVAGSEPTVLERLPVPHTPVSVAVDASGKTCSVASLWAQQLMLVGLNTSGAKGPRLVRRATLDLPFSPRTQLALPATIAGSSSKDSAAGKMLVTDAFGGRLLVVDPGAAKITGELSIAGHHLRGLALHGPFADARDSRPQLLISHQVLNSNTSTTHEHVFWGGVVGNRLRALELDVLSNPSSKAPVPGNIEVLGRTGVSAGDPAEVAVTAQGATIIALSGVDEVAIRATPRDPFTEIDVGRRPTAVALSDDGSEAYVANTLDDSISVITLNDRRVAATISIGTQPRLSLADRGEQLFYDSRLSLDGWYSCHSCHTDGHTNGLLNDNLGDEYFGAPKKILSLLGTSDTSPWAWNGRAASLEAQLEKSLRASMQSDSTNITPEKIQALKAYLGTLAPPPGLDAARGTTDAAAVKRGEAVFKKENCADCHAPATYTTPGVFDVGLQDERGLKEFNPPSLRGVSQRPPFFHDNRAATLREVFAKYKHGSSEALSDRDLEDLVRFLSGL